MAVENKNKGRDYTKIGNLDTIQEQQRGRPIMTVYCEYCEYREADIADIAIYQMEQKFDIEYPPDLIALSILYAFNGVRFQ